LRHVQRAQSQNLFASHFAGDAIGWLSSTTTHHMKTTTHEIIENARIIRSTEKAHLIEVRIGDERTANVWMPKSHVTVDGDTISASSWIIDQKSAELGGNIAAQSAALLAVPANMVGIKCKSRRY
jgi:hypothetical protein